jgi:hypothetical protein
MQDLEIKHSTETITASSVEEAVSFILEGVTIFEESEKQNRQ